MRRSQVIKGLNNSQKVRVIVNGVGFYTTVQSALDMCFTRQRSAVEMALTTIGLSKIAKKPITGFASNYDFAGTSQPVEVQVDLI